MRIPINLLVFLAIAGVFYLVILPKKAAFTKSLLHQFGGGPVSRQDSTKAMVTARILVDICPEADLSVYREGAWSDYGEDASAVFITHTFTCDGNEKKFLFRLYNGSVGEIVDLR